MIRNFNMSKEQQRTMRRSRAALTVSMILIAVSLITICGCATTKPKVVIMPADMAIGIVEAGSTVTMTVTNDVYLVPPARMQWFMRQLSLKGVPGERK